MLFVLLNIVILINFLYLTSQVNLSYYYYQLPLQYSAVEESTEEADSQ